MTDLTKKAVIQELVDSFYWQAGPCCAGCDWWRHHNSIIGECTRSAPVSESERIAMLGLSNCSRPIGAGHVFTPREHKCGDFVDSFDWSSLPLAYAKLVGAKIERSPL